MPIMFKNSYPHSHRDDSIIIILYIITIKVFNGGVIYSSFAECFMVTSHLVKPFHYNIIITSSPEDINILSCALNSIIIM